MVTSEVGVSDALGALRDRLEVVRLPLDAPKADTARAIRRESLAQLDDYVLPRLRHLDAPLLAVVGGSTGVGKSTLVNALVGRVVTNTGVIRPTTRSPVLVHHPSDVDWFDGPRIFPDLRRVAGEVDGGLHLVADAGIPPGLAVLDAPDIDSIVGANRALAGQLLAAADLWLFVTSAARYADSVPWEFLNSAASRSAATAVVLDRVSPDAADEIRTHLASMLARHGLGDAPLFVVTETALDESRQLPAAVVSELRNWLRTFAADEEARGAAIRRTLDGATVALLRQTQVIAEAADQQYVFLDALRDAATEAYDTAAQRINRASGDGSLLRGELLARWQEFVDTGEFFRSLEAGGRRLRDKAAVFVRGRAQSTAEVRAAIKHGLHTVVVDTADRAADQASTQWRADPTGRGLLGSDDLSRSSADLDARSAEAIEAWQADVIELVRTEEADERFTAQLASFGAEEVGLALMVVVFASSTGRNGAQLGVTGGTAVAGQELLDAIFDDETVDRLVASARTELRARTTELLTLESLRFTSRLDALKLDPSAGKRLRASVDQVQRALEAAE